MFEKILLLCLIAGGMLLFVVFVLGQGKTATTWATIEWPIIGSSIALSERSNQGRRKAGWRYQPRSFKRCLRSSLRRDVTEYLLDEEWRRGRQRTRYP